MLIGVFQRFFCCFLITHLATAAGFSALQQKRLAQSHRETTLLHEYLDEMETVITEDTYVWTEEQQQMESTYHSLGTEFETASIPDLAADTASVYSTSDESSIVSTQGAKLSLAAVLNVDSTTSQHQVAHPLVVGHRGALYQEPENTVASFQKCSDLGCDAVELDVFLLKCNTLVVFHGDGSDKDPGRLDDYCGICGSILDYDATQAKNLPFFPHARVYPCPFEKLGKAYIPTLQEVLENGKESGIIFKIELKGPGTEVPTLELVEKLGMMDQCHFSSFCHDRIARIRAMRPERNQDGSYIVKTGCLFDGEVPFDFCERAKRVGASEVHLRFDRCTRERIRKIHQANMGSMAWFSGPRAMKDAAQQYMDVCNENEAMYRTVLNSGVQSMCVNRPDVLLSMINRWE